MIFVNQQIIEIRKDMRKYIFIGLFSVLLSACTSHEEAGDGGASFPQSVKMAATTVVATSKVESRAYADDDTPSTYQGTWKGGEQLAVHMEAAQHVEGESFSQATYPYVVDANGSMAAKDSEQGFYWRSPNDVGRNVEAWYMPFAENGYQASSPDNTQVAVPLNPTTLAASDFLYSASKYIEYDTPSTIYPLLFCHQLAWVSMQVSSDEPDVKAITSATFGTTDEPLVTAATFSAPSGKQTSSGSREVFGTFLTDNAVKGVISPIKRTVPDVQGVLARYEAVVIPQDMSADGATPHTLFAVTADNGKTYRYKSMMQLKPGFHYIFNLKVVSGKYILVLADAKDWEHEDVPEMERQCVIAELWQGGDNTGTTASPKNWDGKETTGTSTLLAYWGDLEENPGTTSDVDNWGDKEANKGTESAVDNWGDKETNKGTESAVDDWTKYLWGKGTTVMDANSWKKEENDDGTTLRDNIWQLEKAGLGNHFAADDWKNATDDRQDVGFGVNNWKKEETTDEKGE